MELTRLRRLLREYEGHGYDDLRALTDACDRFREEIETHEDALRRGEGVSSDALAYTVETQAKALVATILSIPGMAPRVWNALVETQGYKWVQLHMERERQSRESVEYDALHELSEHPF